MWVKRYLKLAGKFRRLESSARQPDDMNFQVDVKDGIVTKARKGLIVYVKTPIEFKAIGIAFVPRLLVADY